MKKLKIFPIILAALLAAALLPAPKARALEDPVIDSKVGVVQDLKTGEVYFSQNADLRVAPASITKIMTGLLTVEAVEAGAISLDDEVTANPSMNYDLIAEGSSAGIRSGETMTLGNLLYCSMLSSANEACNIIAEYVSGSIDAFIDRMNQRAAELGCTGTHFANTHGLPNADHYTTAADFCRIAQEAAGHSLLMEICNTPSYDVPATNLSGVRNIKNSNALICADSMYGSSYLYAPAKGIKTGHTNDAGFCLISTAEKDGISLMAAVFGGAAKLGDTGRTNYTNFTDSITLYEWVFNNFSYQEVLSPNENVASVDVKLGKDANFVNLRPSAPVSLLLPNDYDRKDFHLDPQVYSLQQGQAVTAPVTAGQVLGEISVIRHGQNCGTVKLVASSSVDLSRTQYILNSITETLTSAPFIIIALVVLLILGLYSFWVIRYRVRREKYRRAAALRNADGASEPPPARDPKIEFIPGDEAPAAEPSATAPAPIQFVPPQPEPDAAPAPEPVPAPGPESAPEILPPEETPPAPAPRRTPFFEMDDPDAPLTQPKADAPAEEEDVSMSLFRDQADRDYFEEFFRKK